MIKTKTFLFSNFENKEASNSIINNNLKIKNLQNMKTSNGVITSWNNITSAFNIFFNEEQANIIQDSNKDIINKIVKLIPYEFFDQNKNDVILRLFVETEDNQLYELNNNNTFEFKHQLSNKLLNIFIVKNTLYLFSKSNECIIVENNNEFIISYLPNIYSFCYTNENLYFVTKDNPFRVYITENIDLKNISLDLSQYKYIDTNFESGNIISLVCIENKAYIIHQYEISKIVANNLLQRITNLTFDIFNNTVCTFNDCIAFFSSCGLFLFDGNNIENLLTNNFLAIKNNAKSFIFNDNFYIYSNDFQNYIFEINLHTSAYNKLYINDLVEFYKIRTLSHHNLFFTTSVENSYQNFSIGKSNQTFQNQFVEFNTTTFDSSLVKQLVNLKINAQGLYTLKITTDSNEYVFESSDTTSLFNLNISGTYFRFKFISNTNFNLNSIMCDVGYLETL